MKNIKYIISAAVAIILTSTLVYIAWPQQYISTQTNDQPAQRQVDYTVIAFGDSLTAGYGLPLSESYPSILETYLEKENLRVKVINAGVSGETSKGNNERALFIKKQKADLILLGIGGNDALRNIAISETRKNIIETIEILRTQDPRPTIILLGMQAPLNAGLSYKKEFDRMYTDIAQTYNIPMIPFIIAEVFQKTEFMLPDGIHPNALGYTYLVQNYIGPKTVSLLKNKNQ